MGQIREAVQTARYACAFRLNSIAPASRTTSARPNSSVLIRRATAVRSAVMTNTRLRLGLGQRKR
jgi:hypothetical protein